MIILPVYKGNFILIKLQILYMPDRCATVIEPAAPSGRGRGLFSVQETTPKKLTTVLHSTFDCLRSDYSLFVNSLV